MLAISVLTAGLVCAGSLTHPSVAYAATAEVQQTLSHVVSFDSQGSVTEHATAAATVGDFLRERGITVASHDYISPAADVPITDRLTITYRPAVNVTIVTATGRRAVLTAASDVGSLLEEQHIRLDAQDAVQPAIAEAVPANGIIRISRLMTWQRTEHRAIAMKTLHRLDFSLSPGMTRIVSRGNPGQRDVMVRFTQRDGGDVNAIVIGSHVTRNSKPRVIAEGVGRYAGFERLAERGVQRTSYLAESALRMIATAYTAGCGGCSGITASGYRAGHGIVAVDPSVIPLGTRLFIRGYGFAVAGDTGGAIHGNRIDLGFDSMRDAMTFGRREVVVYRVP